MEYIITDNFKRRYDKKDSKSRESVEKTIKLLVENIRHPGLQTHKVRSTRNIFEAYVDSNARLTFQYGTDKLILRNNCTHDAVLRSP